MPHEVTPIHRRVGAGGSFFDSPIVLYDQTLTGTGGIRTSVEFHTGDSKLFKFIVSVDTVPLQYHENRPAALPLPPEGAGHAWVVRTREDLGPDDWEFDPPTVTVWRQLNTTLAWHIRKVAGVPKENTGIFEVGSSLTGDLQNPVKIYAEAAITVQHDGN